MQTLLPTCNCRSTVEFAREVSEAKAMDDTVNKLEEMFTGGGASSSPITAPRRGTSPPAKTINWGTPKQNSTTVDVSHVAMYTTIMHNTYVID